MPGSRSQQDQKPTAMIEVGQDLSSASLRELQQELQVRIKDLQTRRDALVSELQAVDEQLLALFQWLTSETRSEKYHENGTVFHALVAHSNKILI